jgi:hypothetical protein
MGPKKKKYRNRKGARSKPAPDQPRATPPDTAPGPTAASNGLIPGLFALFESVFFGDAPEQRPGAAGGGGGGADATPADDAANHDTTNDAAIAAMLGAEDDGSDRSEGFGDIFEEWESFPDAAQAQPGLPEPPPPPPRQAAWTLARFCPGIKNDGECCWLAALVQILLRIAHAVPTLLIGPKALADALYGGPTAWATPATTMATLARVLVSERVVPHAKGQHDATEALGGLLAGPSGGALADACRIRVVSELTFTGGCACGSGFEPLKSDDSYMPELFAPSGSATALTVQQLVDAWLHEPEQVSGKCDACRCAVAIHSHAEYCGDCRYQHYLKRWRYAAAGAAPPPVLFFGIKRYDG